MNATSLTISEYSAETSGPTPEQIANATLYLVKSRDSLVASLIGLSISQLEFKSAPDRWSITEIVEHLAIIEGAIHKILAQMPQAPPCPPGWSEAEVDAAVLRDVPQRSASVIAPPHICPTGRQTAAEAVVEFLDRRDRPLQLLSSPCLRGRMMPHPTLGFWDGYQWLLATACHALRHLEQIREVKADPGFPSALASDPASSVN